VASVGFIDVSKRFADGTEALAGIELRIEDGELMVVVGPSGCGKSTALRLLAGLEQPTAGELRIDDEVVNDMAPQQRNVAMVFQNYALYPHMNVRRNLEFPLRMQKLPADEIARRTAWATQLLQLDGLMERLPKQLSGGQRQRVAMGRAIVREPRAFLMDEPLSNLDAKLRVQIRGEIAALQRRLGITTLYVTHDQVEAMTLGDRVAVMHAGRLQQVSAPQVLYERPANIFVAQFIGSPGMNIYASRLQRTDNGLACAFADHWLDLPPDGHANLVAAQAHIDRPVYIGLRPEAFARTDVDVETLTMTVKAVEALGHEQLLYADIPQVSGENTAIRLPALPMIAIGDRLPLAVDSRRIHLFDAQGRAIDGEQA